MRPVVLVLTVAALTVGLAPPASADFKNLQVLPKTLPKDQLKATMKTWTKALGVECDHCHEPPEMDKDTKNKKLAREMLKMTIELNEKFLKGMDQKVTCETCHRGKEKPDVK